MNRSVLQYGRQVIDGTDIEAVVDVLQSDFLTQGPLVERFEAALAERVGARHAVAVSSGTAALHIACIAAGVGPGDRGLTSAITFAASANCVIYASGNAGFVDIDAAALGMSPAALAQAIQIAPSVKVVIPVHLAGLAHAMTEVREIAGGRIVIEDAAHALGGLYPSGKAVGCCAYSDLTVFSFHPVKQITTGEGGAVLTNDAELARRLKLLRNHGIEREPARFIGDEIEEDGLPKPWLSQQQMLGFNYRMTDIQAALGLSQLRKLDRFLARRREIAGRYDNALAKLPFVRLLQVGSQERARSGLHLYIVWFDFEAMRTTRTAVMTKLKESGVGSQVHYMPVYHHPFHAQREAIGCDRFPQAEEYYRGCLSLPLHPGLTDENIECVIAAVNHLAPT